MNGRRPGARWALHACGVRGQQPSVRSEPRGPEVRETSEPEGRRRGNERTGTKPRGSVSPSRDERRELSTLTPGRRALPRSRSETPTQRLVHASTGAELCPGSIKSGGLRAPSAQGTLPTPTQDTGSLTASSPPAPVHLPFLHQPQRPSLVPPGSSAQGAVPRTESTCPPTWPPSTAL